MALGAGLVRGDRGLDGHLRRHWRVRDGGGDARTGKSDEECDDSELAHDRGNLPVGWRRGGGKHTLAESDQTCTAMFLRASLAFGEAPHRAFANRERARL